MSPMIWKLLGRGVTLFGVLLIVLVMVVVSLGATGFSDRMLQSTVSEEVRALRHAGHDPWRHYRSEPELRRALDVIAEGQLGPGGPGALRPVVDALLSGGDPYLVLADYADYAACQERVAAAWRLPARWTRMSILNCARSGRFSSDRTVSEYAREIWGAAPVPIGAPGADER